MLNGYMEKAADLHSPHEFDIRAQHGSVLINVPGGALIALTPQTAADLSDKMLRAAADAYRQALGRAMPHARTGKH